ncbi:hypothetical protein FOA52_005225 [Chlamydomonas sp. UWO 241]|nr:hypothetical protein FOA52_005225 [Chlamydomonas sp. UWO 241]
MPSAFKHIMVKEGEESKFIKLKKAHAKAMVSGLVTVYEALNGAKHRVMMEVHVDRATASNGRQLVGAELMSMNTYGDSYRFDFGIVGHPLRTYFKEATHTSHRKPSYKDGILVFDLIVPEGFRAKDEPFIFVAQPYVYKDVQPRVGKGVDGAGHEGAPAEVDGSDEHTTGPFEPAVKPDAESPPGLTFTQLLLGHVGQDQAALAAGRADSVLASVEEGGDADNKLRWEEEGRALAYDLLCMAYVVAAEDGTSLPVRLATDVVRFLYGGTGRREPADGGVVSASLLNAKPAVGGIGVEPRGGGVLRVLFTVASDAVADTVVRWRHELRRCVDSTAVFDVLSDREEAQHQALWPAFLAAKVAGKRAQFHRARLVVDGERDQTASASGQANHELGGEVEGGGADSEPSWEEEEGDALAYDLLFMGHVMGIVEGGGTYLFILKAGVRTSVQASEPGSPALAAALIVEAQLEDMMGHYDQWVVEADNMASAARDEPVSQAYTVSRASWHMFAIITQMLAMQMQAQQQL